MLQLKKFQGIGIRKFVTNEGVLEKFRKLEESASLNYSDLRYQEMGGKGDEEGRSEGGPFPCKCPRRWCIRARDVDGSRNCCPGVER